MEIKTKFNIGQVVWTIKETNLETKLQRGRIDRIEVFSEKDIRYYNSSFGTVTEGNIFLTAAEAEIHLNHTKESECF